jgi:hypothetical protein
MSEFYDSMVATAQEMMSEFGREVLLTREDLMPTDASKPWKGTSGVPVTQPIMAIVIPPAAVRIWGLAALGDANKFEDLLIKSQKLLIMCPGTIDITQFSSVTDEGKEYGVTAFQILKPGDTVILAYVGISR